MKFPKWSLFVLPILAIVLISMFPIPAIAVAVSVAIWAVIAAQKAAATKMQGKTGARRERGLALLTATTFSIGDGICQGELSE
jgi:hypothetical protein